MAKILITYRKYDTSRDEVERIAEYLRAVSPDDQVTVQNPNDELLTVIREVEQQDVVLVVIGTRWLNMVGDDGKRLIDDSGDTHRAAIMTALEDEHKWVSIILVDGASLPAEKDISSDLQEMLRRDNVILAGLDYQRTLENLRRRFVIANSLNDAKEAVSRVVKWDKQVSNQPNSGNNTTYTQRPPFYAGMALIIVAAFFVVIWSMPAIRESLGISVVEPTPNITSTPRPTLTPRPTETFPVIRSSSSTQLDIARLNVDLAGENFYFSSNGATLYTYTGNELFGYFVGDWDNITRSEPPKFEYNIREVGLSDNKEALIVFLWSGEILVLNPNTYETIESYHFTRYNAQEILLSNNRLYLSTGEVFLIDDEGLQESNVTGFDATNLSNNRLVEIGYFVDNVAFKFYILRENTILIDSDLVLEGYDGYVGIEFSPFANAVIMAKDNQLDFIDPSSGDIMGSEIFENEITHIAINGRHALMAIGFDNNEVAIFSLARSISGILQTIEVPEGISQIGFSPDNRLFLIADNTGNITPYGMAR